MRSLAVFLLAALMMTACSEPELETASTAATAPSTTSTSTTAAPPPPINGVFVLIGEGWAPQGSEAMRDGAVWRDGDLCGPLDDGDSPFLLPIGDAQVVVAGNGGDVIGVSDLGPGALDGLGQSTLTIYDTLRAEERLRHDLRCVHDFTVELSTDSTLFTVSIGEEPLRTFSREELEQLGWRIEITGSL